MPPGGTQAAPDSPGTPPGGPRVPPPPPPGPKPKPPGLREQARRTYEAGRGLLDAHIALAKAEASTILADLTAVVAQVAMAIGCLFYVGLLVSVGSALFLGEWLFGSIGWGILHGTLFSVAIAIVLVLNALRIGRGWLAGTLLVAILLGIGVGIVFGNAWPNEAYAAIGDQAATAVDAATRPLVVGVALWGAVLAFVGLLFGARAGGVGGALGGFVAGAVLGALIGAFTAISFSPQVGAAIGVCVALVTWPVLAALRLRGYDWEDLKRRFTPQASIDAAMDTKAFLEARLPGRSGDEEVEA